MELLNVALQVVAIIAIIAVGAFIIVFLSDLLISIIDDHQGIFFRRGKGKEETYNKTPGHHVSKGIDLSLDNTNNSSPKLINQESVKKEGLVDMEAARREQELLEKSTTFNLNELDDEKNESHKARLSRLEERNKELEEAFNGKDTKEDKTAIKTQDTLNLERLEKEAEAEIAQQKQKPKEKNAKDDELEGHSVDSAPKFEDFWFDSESEEEAEEKVKEKAEDKKDEKSDLEQDDMEEMDFSEYERMINDINKKALEKFNGEEKTEDKKESKDKQLTNEVEDIPSFEDNVKGSEDTIDEKQKASEQSKQENKNDKLAKEIEKLKAQLEEERRQKEKLILEAEEKAKMLVEEREKFDEAKKASRLEKREEKKGINLGLETLEEYEARLDILNDRLKEAKKQLRINKREYVPLNKIRKTLEKDQRKLRRKEAQVAKQKVTLFGVNNHDIDPEKQVELEQQIDMLEGLKLSVQHCEDVMKENEDRFPILEQTNKILSDNVAHLSADIELIESKIKELKGQGDK